MSITEITHHGVVFRIDTMDWSDEVSNQIAEGALIAGVKNLSALDVNRIVSIWTGPDAECDSRNERDEATKIIEAIESEAYTQATAGWMSAPDSGHNCIISIAA